MPLTNSTGIPAGSLSFPEACQCCHAERPAEALSREGEGSLAFCFVIAEDEGAAMRCQFGTPLRTTETAVTICDRMGDN